MVICWFKVNVDEYGIDLMRIVVMGMLVGGYFVLMVGLIGNVVIFEGEIGEYLWFDFKVFCVVDMFGLVELLWMNDVLGRIDYDVFNLFELLFVGGKL